MPPIPPFADAHEVIRQEMLYNLAANAFFNYIYTLDKQR